MLSLNINNICFNYALRTETNYKINNNLVIVTQRNYCATTQHLQVNTPREQHSTAQHTLILSVGVLTH